LPGGLTEDEGAVAARSLLASDPRPTAVTVFNDRCATGVLDVLRRDGLRMPDDMSVVGFDDSSLARLSHVALTTIAQDTSQIAGLAVAQAVARVENTPAGDREQVIPPRLVTRSTSGVRPSTSHRPR
ncbi:substrate-binding domain-containing protein, partial [Pseudonocardia pini]|uniref:substrate-binding domain-containing protein n=1 Tax=Pseudonocardia pini TaxID=2758030 RepID=UPI0015F08FC7